MGLERVEEKLEESTRTTGKLTAMEKSFSRIDSSDIPTLEADLKTHIATLDEAIKSSKASFDERITSVETSVDKLSAREVADFKETDSAVIKEVESPSKWAGKS